MYFFNPTTYRIHSVCATFFLLIFFMIALINYVQNLHIAQPEINKYCTPLAQQSFCIEWIHELKTWRINCHCHSRKLSISI